MSVQCLSLPLESNLDEGRKIALFTSVSPVHGIVSATYILNKYFLNK